MAQCVDQSAGAEPRLGQGWEQLRGAVVRSECPANVAQLLQGDSQAKMCIGVARVDGDGPLQCRDGIRYAADLEAGEAEIVLDDGIGRLQQRGVAQGRDRINWSPGPQRLSGQRKQSRDLLRRDRVWRLGHDANLAWYLKRGHRNRQRNCHAETTLRAVIHAGDLIDELLILCGQCHPS